MTTTAALIAVGFALSAWIGWLRHAGKAVPRELSVARMVTAGASAVSVFMQLQHSGIL
jgi:hypothetical protein